MPRIHFPQVIFFCVFLAALIPVLYYYYRRNPNPRFRPSAGEMLTISVVALVVGGGASFFLGNFFYSDPTLRALEGRPDHDAGTDSRTSSPLQEKEDEEKEEPRGRVNR